MSQEHKQRWVAAVIGVVLLFGTYFLFGHWGLVFLSVLLSSVAYYEFLSFSGAARKLRKLSATAGVVLSAWLCLDLPGALLSVYAACLLVLLRVLWQAHSSPAELLKENFLHAQTRIFALVYLVVFPSFVPRLHALAHGPVWLLFLLCLIWLGDTAAYYGGKTMGKNKLSPNVSPGKTMEGALTALVACAILALAFSRFSLTHLAPWKLVVVAILSSIVAQAGDLLESLMKRAYQVKDSGRLIPGHGGVFDRFDSLILAAPFFYLLVRLVS
jgi:phosphatidate cytidylyltransferase